MRLLAVLFLSGLAVTVAASWLLPRITREPDQFEVALELIETGRARDAVFLMQDPVWRGIAEYRAKRYHRALAEMIQRESVLTLYNVGNAYALLHEWNGAIAAYEKALRLDPGHADATHNLEVVKRAKQAERELIDKEWNTRKMGRWNDGNKNEERSDDGDDFGGKVVQKEIEHGERGQAAKQESSGSGTTSAEGLLGDKQKGDKALAGNAPSDDPNAQSDADIQAAATGVVRMLESAREAEILLNRIKDDPAKVLRARFRAIHRQRVEERQ